MLAKYSAIGHILILIKLIIIVGRNYLWPFRTRTLMMFYGLWAMGMVIGHGLLSSYLWMGCLFCVCASLHGTKSNNILVHLDLQQLYGAQRSYLILANTGTNLREQRVIIVSRRFATHAISFQLPTAECVKCGSWTLSKSVWRQSIKTATRARNIKMKNPDEWSMRNRGKSNKNGRVPVLSCDRISCPHHNKIDINGCRTA